MENDKMIHATTIVVTDLDLGDYSSEMTVGTNQLLSITVLPFDATNQTVTYKSSNTQVATVNAMGRIVAVAKGNAVITVQAGSVKKELTIKVKEEEVTQVLHVTDLDIGDYQKEMTIGTNLLLSITVLPANATNQDITYQSSDTAVATVNAMGRVTAVAKGTTTITVQSGSVKKEFLITVKEEEVTETIEVTDLDLGEYQKEMTIGTTQLLGITVLPTNATKQDITYSSNNLDILTVNDLGRVTAKKIGKAKITVTSGKVSKVISIEVKKEETEEQTIPVTSIEVDEFKEEMKVEETQSITASVLPSDATKSAISYTSSNPSVATISGTGKITALKKGTTTITLSADGVTKELSLTVVVSTAKIEVNTTYSVLKVGETIALGGKVYPEEAAQTLTYKALNEQVISVSNKGVVTAKASGSSSVIVSNGDIQTIVTIIVNETESVVQTNESSNQTSTIEQESHLLTTIKAVTDDIITLQVEEVPELTNTILRYLYEHKKTLVLESTQYSLVVVGTDLINLENTLIPKLEFKQEEEGISFVVNEGKNLPGRIFLRFHEVDKKNANFVYLYHEGKEKYELLNTKIQQGEIEIDVTGTYKITESKLNSFHWNFIVIGIVVVCLLGGVIAYICVAKKYWFW